MSGLTPEAVRAALAAVPYPGFSRDIVAFGLVKDIVVDSGRVAVTLVATTRDPEVVAEIRARATEAVRALPDVRSVELTVLQSPAAARLPSADRSAPQPAPLPIATHIVGVASGKGGVGKSTVAVNLAVALARRGRRVGFLDADVHGPSAPLMFGVEGARTSDFDADRRPRPLEAHGVKVMSMGFFIGREDAVIWRGPIVGNFIRQLLTDIAWGDLDDMIIDFPPGTGDAQLTISQTLRMTGVVVVTTPNDLALIDALKAMTMFRKVDVPVFGLVENMSFFACPHCGERTEIFGAGLVDKASRDNGIPLLARVPIDPQVVSDSDHGVPVVVARPESLASLAYQTIAEAVLHAADDLTAPRSDTDHRPAPSERKRP